MYDNFAKVWVSMEFLENLTHRELIAFLRWYKYQPTTIDHQSWKKFYFFCIKEATNLLQKMGTSKTNIEQILLCINFFSKDHLLYVPKRKIGSFLKKWKITFLLTLESLLGLLSLRDSMSSSANIFRINDVTANNLVTREFSRASTNNSTFCVTLLGIIISLTP